MVAAAQNILRRKVARTPRRHSHGRHISVSTASLKENSRIEHSTHHWSVIERSENRCLTSDPCFSSPDFDDYFQHDADWSSTPSGTHPLVNELYQGMAIDPVTSLYYERARNYSPSLGTCISQDPLQYINGADTYQYVMSNPVGTVDPKGQAGEFPIGGDFTLNLHMLAQYLTDISDWLFSSPGRPAAHFLLRVFCPVAKQASAVQPPVIYPLPIPMAGWGVAYVP